jgi:SAM-dependent methyltransferase
MRTETRPRPPADDHAPVPLASWTEERAVIAKFIRGAADTSRPLQILEAGCGQGWGVDLNGVDYVLTGIDSDEKALEIRTNVVKDMHASILGDLRTVQIAPARFDVIFSSYVLEHVHGAADVLANFVKWLKPGGIILLIIPNRDSSWGFLTRVTPFWFHVLYKRYVAGDKLAGTPGHGPYPTAYERVVSLRGIREFYRRNGLEILGEYRVGLGRSNTSLAFRVLTTVVEYSVSFLSLFRLSARYSNLLFVLRKPATAGPAD